MKHGQGANEKEEKSPGAAQWPPWGLDMVGATHALGTKRSFAPAPKGCWRPGGVQIQHVGVKHGDQGRHVETKAVTKKTNTARSLG